jgi:hypothetical protein
LMAMKERSVAMEGVEKVLPSSVAGLPLGKQKAGAGRHRARIKLRARQSRWQCVDHTAMQDPSKPEGKILSLIHPWRRDGQATR